MDSSLPVFNWSLKKLLSTEPDSFNKARIRILYIMVVVSIVKALIVIGIARYHDQGFQFGRAVVVFSCFCVFLKVLLTSRKAVLPLTHAMLTMGLLLIWSSIFFYSGTINVITMQFVYMLIVCSFYLLPIRYSVAYSFLAFAPAVLATLYPGIISSTLTPVERLASPAYEIIVSLNFLTVIITHYLFRQSFLENLAEKESLNIRLTEAVKEAREAADSRSEFLSTMSHELRTPLNSVIAISEMLLHGADEKEQEENLGILKNSATGLHSLINNILDFNRLGSGKLELEAIPVDIGSLLAEVCTGLRFQARQKQVGLELNRDETLSGIRVLSDPTRLRQIMYNLIGNAIKFTEEGKVTVTLQAISLGESVADLRICVQDTGIGIEADRLNAIFDPFQQGGAGVARNFGGSGLGLAIVKRLLEAFNSTIDVKSSPGSGSEFSFRLSLVRASGSEGRTEPAGAESADLLSLRILVAEDNSMNRLVLTKVLSRWNLVPVFAENGRDAVERLSAEDFDLVLMDLHMPVMDGYQAAEAIRKLPDPRKSGIRIIALSASATDTLDRKLGVAGIDGFLLKPFRIEDLLDTLRQAATRPAEATG